MEQTNIKNAIEQIKDRISPSDHIILLNALESDREANRICQDNCRKRRDNIIAECRIQRARQDLEMTKERIKAGNSYAKASLSEAQRAYDEALAKKNNDMI